jgi:N6-adenosine-specific RNA methylase IME4
MKKYGIIYADPPWHYKVYSKKGEGRSAESHYSTMSIEDIRALPVSKLGRGGLRPVPLDHLSHAERGFERRRGVEVPLQNRGFRLDQAE